MEPAVAARVVVLGPAPARQRVAAYPKSFLQLFDLHSTSFHLKDLEFQSIQLVGLPTGITEMRKAFLQYLIDTLNLLPVVQYLKLEYYAVAMFD